MSHHNLGKEGKAIYFGSHKPKSGINDPQTSINGSLDYTEKKKMEKKKIIFIKKDIRLEIIYRIKRYTTCNSLPLMMLRAYTTRNP
jgi:hypothetical protein